MSMKILVVGAGGIGGYFGGRLVQAGADVTFLVRAYRQQLLKTHGLRIQSPLGDYSGEVKTVLKEQLGGSTWDVVILTCKAYDLPSALDSIEPVVGPHTAILPLLNGLQHIETLNQRFGAQRVLGGLAKILSMVDAEGVVHHTSRWCYITFGEQDGTLSERVKQLHALFPSDTVTAAAVPDMQQKMWEKMVHLVTTAGIASLMRASIGEVASVPGGIELLVRFLEHNAEVAKHAGHPMSAQFMDEYRELFQDKTLQYVPSLLRDIERHRPTEGEHIMGYMLDLARKYRVDTSLYELINIGLRAYELRRTTDRLKTAL